MVTTRITVKQYLAEYCIGKYNNYQQGPVRFPDSLDIYHVIYDLMQKCPNVPNLEGNLQIVLPERAYGKCTRVYNYMSKESSRILSAKLQTMFYADAHEYLDEQKHRKGVPYLESACRFLAKYGINSITQDAIIKNHLRWRQHIRQRDKRSYNKK